MNVVKESKVIVILFAFTEVKIAAASASGGQIWGI